LFFAARLACFLTEPLSLLGRVPTIWLGHYLAGAPILNILVPQSGQVPSVAGLPFFMVTGVGFFISFLALHFMQYASIEYASIVCPPFIRFISLDSFRFLGHPDHGDVVTVTMTLLQLPSAVLLFAASWHLTCSIRQGFQKPQGFSARPSKTGWTPEAEGRWKESRMRPS